MKLTKSLLRQIIKEELETLAREGLNQDEKDKLTSLKRTSEPSAPSALGLTAMLQKKI